MCNPYTIVFGAVNLKREDIEGRKVIEVGSYVENGTIRPYIETLHPASYVGVDIIPGESVDIVCSVENLLEKFGRNSFDVVISTEMIEHVRNWRNAISNIKNICKPGGIILMTTRTPTAAYHAHPYDFWRFEKRGLYQHLFGFHYRKT